MKPQSNAGTSTAKAAIPWNAWGLVYLGGGLGMLIGLADTAIHPGAVLSAALWAAWGLLLAAASAATVAAFATAQAENAKTGKILKRTALLPIRLAAYLIPGVPIWRNPYSERHAHDGTLSKRRVVALLTLWSLWGLLCACLGGLEHWNAAYYPLFAAIFIVPALIGWGRYKGILA